MKNKFIKIMMILQLVISSNILFAKEMPSGAEMLLDLILVRPLSVGGLAVGTVCFIAMSPFNLSSGNMKQSFKETGQRLVVYPFKYTFVRRLGHYPGYMEELELISE